ncbi:MAG: glycosyltransferase [Microbacterium sp.]|nr:glycosyltransferase [Microbacterium sp.]|tara:strand:- start:967 stop:1728 length:762 start_codon:yes stop_codon:yes gene_type:complete
MKTVHVGGVPFRATDLAESVNWLMSAIQRGDPTSIRLANAYCVSLTRDDATYRDLLCSAGANLPDGAPVALVMRAKGAPTAQRVRGPSFFERALLSQELHGSRPFFLGSTPETLAALEDTLRERYPSLKAAGFYSPPYAPVSESFLEECEGAVRSSSANMIWVGLGTPKQDYVSTALAARLGMPAAGVGAAFDFLAGTVPEAPPWVQRSGFEWAYRFAAEPRRLWKRYTVGNIKFCLQVATKWRSTSDKEQPS